MKYYDLEKMLIHHIFSEPTTLSVDDDSTRLDCTAPVLGACSRPLYFEFFVSQKVNIMYLLKKLKIIINFLNVYKQFQHFFVVLLFSKKTIVVLYFNILL